jgi:glycosyltransferase involved in cell wall biosynthesis
LTARSSEPHGVTPPRRIERVVVAIPARNEEATLGACLASVERAAARWRGPVTVVVGADSCDDDTASVARAGQGGAHRLVIEGSWQGAGATRRAITGAALRDAADPAAIGLANTDAIWLANTDADTIVPPGWIVEQVAAAQAGADVVLGTVQLDPRTMPPSLVRAFRRRYRGEGPVSASHRHVHGANLGVRASVHDAAGGWSADLAVGEDHDLVRRCVTVGAVVHRSESLTVTTSNRTAGRAPHGFATDLAALVALVALDSPRA